MTESSSEAQPANSPAPVPPVPPDDLAEAGRYILVRNLVSRSRVYFAGVLGEDTNETTRDVTRARIFSGATLRQTVEWTGRWEAVAALDLIDWVQAEARQAKEQG